MRIFKKGTKGKKTEEFGGSNTVMLVVLMPHDSNFQLNDTRGDESFIRHSLPPVIFKGLWAHLRKKKLLLFLSLFLHIRVVSKYYLLAKGPRGLNLHPIERRKKGEKKKIQKIKLNLEQLIKVNTLA